MQLSEIPANERIGKKVKVTQLTAGAPSTYWGLEGVVKHFYPPTGDGSRVIVETVVNGNASTPWFYATELEVHGTTSVTDEHGTMEVI